MRKLVCKFCGTELPVGRLDECVMYIYDPQNKTLELDKPCRCGSVLFHVVLCEREVELWPKENIEKYHA